MLPLSNIVHVAVLFVFSRRFVTSQQPNTEG